MTLLDILPAEQKDIVNQIQTNQDLNQLQYYFSKLTPREQRDFLWLTVMDLIITKKKTKNKLQKK